MDTPGFFLFVFGEGIGSTLSPEVLSTRNLGSQIGARVPKIFLSFFGHLSYNEINLSERGTLS